MTVKVETRAFHDMWLTIESIHTVTDSIEELIHFKKKMYQNNSKTKPGNFFRFMLMRFRSMIWLSFIFVIQFETYFATEPNFQSFQFIFSELSFWPLFRIIDDFPRSTRKSIIESREPEIIEKEQIEKCSLRKFFNC